MHRSLGSLLEPPLLQLHLLGQPTPLDVGQEERLNQVLNQSLVVVVPPLKALQVLVHLLLAQVGHDAGLPVRSTLHCIIDDPVEVAVNCPLVHLHDLFVQALLPRPDYLLSVSTTRLLHFPTPPLVLSLLHLRFYLLLFSDPHQFFG